MIAAGRMTSVTTPSSYACDIKSSESCTGEGLVSGPQVVRGALGLSAHPPVDFTLARSSIRAGSLVLVGRMCHDRSRTPDGSVLPVRPLGKAHLAPWLGGSRDDPRCCLYSRHPDGVVPAHRVGHRRGSRRPRLAGVDGPA